MLKAEMMGKCFVVATFGQAIRDNDSMEEICFENFFVKFAPKRRKVVTSRGGKLYGLVVSSGVQLRKVWRAKTALLFHDSR